VTFSLDDFDYTLPPSCIAQAPAPEREAARLFVLDRATGERTHARVAELPRLLRAGDLLVVNATRVLPARLRGEKRAADGPKRFVLGPLDTRSLARLLRAGASVGLGLRGSGEDAFEAAIAAIGDEGEIVLALAPEVSPYRAGEAPLPPYIRRDAAQAADLARYQTVFARVPGAVAAPTAGLHLGDALLRTLAAAGVECAEVVLHVGPGTFRPLRDSDLAAGRLHPEPYELPAATAAAIARTRARGGRVVAVGTTTTRVLESCATAERGVRAGCGETDLFLRPGSELRVVDVLFTNFHLPRSSLLLLVAAFAGRERILDAYA
jgi:S-adenosylmethionine:tRNA ribosyltransferase-isomerase